jgi:hypothetical protein
MEITGIAIREVFIVVLELVAGKIPHIILEIFLSHVPIKFTLYCVGSVFNDPFLQFLRMNILEVGIIELFRLIKLTCG